MQRLTKYSQRTPPQEAVITLSEGSPKRLLLSYHYNVFINPKNEISMRKYLPLHHKTLKTWSDRWALMSRLSGTVCIRSHLDQLEGGFPKYFLDLFLQVPNATFATVGPDETVNGLLTHGDFLGIDSRGGDSLDE